MEKMSFFSVIYTDLFLSHKMIIFHFWLSPFMKYLFLYHSMKINRVCIEKQTEYPLFIIRVIEYRYFV